MSMNYPLSTVLQGQFSNWINKFPLKVTNWFDPKINNLIYIATLTLNKGVWIRNESKSIVDSKQPEISQLKNCTAAVTQQGLLMYPWFVVHCDTEYEASFVCQDIKSHSPPVKVAVNRTCDGHWFMINGSSKCFSVFWQEVALSFNDAQNICSAQNSSVFNVDVMSRIVSKMEGFQLKLDLLSLLEEDIHNQYFVHSISASDMYNSIFGKLLAADARHSRLPSMITNFFNIYGEFNVFTFFAYLNNSCSVIEKSWISFLVDAADTFKSNKIRGWGVKCRSCSEPLNVTGVICEKDSKPYTISCLSQHFECNDRTCIVDIYRCDSVIDCFDGSDEDHCDIHINNMTNQFVNVPYLLPGMNIMLIHSICDGIYINRALSHEEDICFKYKLKQITLSSTAQTDLFAHKKAINIMTDDIFMLLVREKQLCLKSQKHVMAQLNHVQQLSWDMQFNTIRKLTKCSDLRDVCIVGADGSCDASESVFACADFSCPGLFKCHRDYCIYMSSVCDGQYDCEEGDDEIFCPFSSCPGLLKCRGETRCVSREEICDNIVNCLHSMDDEISCNNCPVNCECSGYAMICHLENSIEKIKHNGTNYIKGLILKGVQKQLFINNIFISRLVYLNVSYCVIENILPSRIKYSVPSFILIASFLQNKLTDANFLSASIFQNIVFLDLSFNRLSIFMYEQFSALKELIVLILRGNPLIRISLDHAPPGSMLYVLDLQHIYHYSNLYIIFSKHISNQIRVKVSELLFCCILDQNIKCTYNENGKICIGLFWNTWSKLIFYIFSIMALAISLMANIRNIIQIMTPTPLHSRKKYYCITVFNNSISEFLTCLYLFSLLVADATKVNVLFWTLNPICLILKIISYISIQTMIILKTHALFCMSLQILYPFKHQNGYLKWTAPMSFFVWYIASSSSFSTYFEKLDELCSIAKCSEENTLNLLLFVVCVTQTLAILSSILIAIKVYIVLEENNTTWAKLQTEQRHSINSFSVILKLTCSLISHLPLQFCLLSLLVVKLVKVLYAELFCRQVFLFVLPINVVCFSLVSIYRN